MIIYNQQKYEKIIQKRGGKEKSLINEIVYIHKYDYLMIIKQRSLSVGNYLVRCNFR